MKWQKKKSQNEKMAGTKYSSIHSEVILYLLFRNMTVSFSSERAYSREVFPIGRIIREHIKKTHTKRMECTHYESLDVFFFTHTHTSVLAMNTYSEFYYVPKKILPNQKYLGVRNPPQNSIKRATCNVPLATNFTLSTFL